MLNKRTTVLIIVFSFVLGIFLSSFAPGIPACDLCFIIFCSLIITSFALRSEKYLFVITLAGAFLFLGIWRLEISRPITAPDKIWYYNGQELEFSGMVSSEPDARNNKLNLEIKAQDLEGKVLVSTDLYPKYHYGDILDLGCRLKAPEEFEGFAYDRYLARYDIYSLCYYPEIRFVSRDKSLKSGFFRGLFVFKRSLKAKIDKFIPEPEAGLLNAMVLGYKRGISNSLREDLSGSGLSHIAAISGLHISLFSAGAFIFFIYIGLNRKRAFILSSIILFLYITLIGFPASAVRAGIMAFMFLLAMAIGRLNRLAYCLSLVAFVLLMINPKLLRDDLGFQLSFLAVLGIALIYPLLKEKIRFKGFLAEMIFVSISAQVFTLPLVAWNFKVISFVSPLANLFILWLLPFVLSLSILSLFLSFISLSLAAPFFFLVFLMLKYITFIAWILSFGSLNF
ncbi:DUF4131 domain-containing protein [Candidatus Falkowbacteria bacterium]|nr:DUF4131 domain-containing protein [Candidatus Falkowbacteria bacterium]